MIRATIAGYEKTIKEYLELDYDNYEIQEYKHPELAGIVGFWHSYAAVSYEPEPSQICISEILEDHDYLFCLAHEFVHLQQVEREGGYWDFKIRYNIEEFKNGYENNIYEREANMRAADYMAEVVGDRSYIPSMGQTQLMKYIPAVNALKERAENDRLNEINSLIATWSDIAQVDIPTPDIIETTRGMRI
jgi:hypothetical protein